ncbi:MAG: A24 family peptidase [Thiohalomonadaceae bacterium]
MDELAYFFSDPVVYTLASAVLGLAIGSFLNVVIYRLPVMLNRTWQNQCAELAGGEAAVADEPFNLAVPGSTCPHCGHRIRPWENIPVLSYVLQRGRCTGCGGKISLRYPVIESVTALLTAAVAWHFGFGWQGLAGMTLTWALIALTMIDFDHQLLPDDIALPMLWLGLLLSLFGVFVDTTDALIGAMAGYLSLWSVYHLFRLLTGKEGMGYGDFKLLALLGAWLGWKMLPLIILLSSLVGAVVGITLILVRGHDRNVPIPFGPYLAAAGWLALMWGDELTGLYLNWLA